MIIEKIKQSDVVRFLAFFVFFGTIYAVSSYILLMLAGQILDFGRAIFSTSDILVSGFIFFLLFVGIYIFIYKNDKSVKYKTIKRGLLYALFFNFSAVAMFAILTPVINYTGFLRFHVSDVNFTSIFIETTFWLAIVCFFTYTAYTSLMEIQKNKIKVLRQLVYWFIATIFAGYCSILALFFYTGFGYLKNCLPKELIAEDYCYSIGESIYHWWQPVPATVVFIIMVVFMIFYFSRVLKTKEK